MENNEFKQLLKNHGTKGRQFAQISDIENKAVLGCSAKQYKANKGIKATANTRDHLTQSQNASLRMIEIHSSDKIERDNATTGEQCKTTVSKVSNVIANTLLELDKI